MQEFLHKIDSLFEFLVRASVTIPTTFLLLPLLTSVFIAFFIFAKCVHLLAKWFGNPDLCEPLAFCSAGVALTESPFKETPSEVMVFTAVVEGVPDIPKIRKMIRERLFRKKDQQGKPYYPELLQTLEYFMGYPFWRRIPGMTEEKGLEKHVKVHKRDGGWDQTSLLDFTKSFGSQQFKEGEPLIELATILDDYKVPGSSVPHFAVLTKVQHSLSDGTGGFSLLRDIRGGRSSQGVDEGIMKIVLPPGYYLHKFLSPIYRGVYDLVSMVMNGVIFTAPGSIWPKSPNKKRNSGRGNPDFSAAQPFSLGGPCATLTTVRRVSKAWGVSCTAVILTAVLRSVRTTLFPKDAMLPSFLMVVVPTASPQHSGKLGNESSAIALRLPLYIANPAVHAGEVDTEFQNVKKSSVPHTVQLLCTLGGTVPNCLIGNLESKQGFLCFSTIMGPKEDPKFCGDRIKGMSTLFPCAGGQTFPMFQLISMADKLYLTLTADKGLIADDEMARRIVMGFHEEITRFEEILMCSAF